MPGPTPWQQSAYASSLGAQTITTTTETVICTLSGVTSRGQGFPVNLSGFAQFAVNAATTATLLRVRLGSVTGGIVGSVTGQYAATAGTATFDQLQVATTDNPTGEYAGQVYVLTIQATAAGANWNVTAATLSATI